MLLTKELVRFIRQTNRLGQRAFASRLNVSHSYIAMIETGRKPVTAGLSLRIAREFEIDVDYIENARRFI
ncbi:helix-turn-helix domain-containing protein [Heyndrickxia ginsengihumi]|uniref:helix-turn-helix domain-containing protein n=1 Tax=Heyndrickxia ginsengihumi TaxID=363870 RepID=UPI003D23E2F2